MNAVTKEALREAKKAAKAAEKESLKRVELARLEARKNKASAPLTPRQEQRKNAVAISNILRDLEALGLQRKVFFGFATVPQMIIQTVFTVQFNPHENFDEALALTGLSEFTINEIIANTGTNCKVNLEDGIVEMGTAGNPEALAELIEMAGDEMGLLFDVDTASVTQEAMDKLLENNYKYCENQLKLSLAEAAKAEA